MFISSIAAFSWFLYDHPGLKVDKRGTVFWYDKEQDKFFYQKDSNKVRNGILEAKGLRSDFDVLIRSGFYG